jgi:hypothetical protein
MLRARNQPAFLATEAVMIGAGSSLGPRGFDAGAQEVVVKLVADHPTAEGAGLMVHEQFWAMSSGVPGNSIAFGTGVTPLMHLASFLVAKSEVTALIDMGDGAEALADAHLPDGFNRASLPLVPAPAAPDPARKTVELPLSKLAWLRSGEKGETINIGVIAREPAQLPWIRAGVEAALKDGWLDHLFGGAAARFKLYDLPGIAAFNVVLEGALPGGINNSTRLDPAAKSVAQQMVGMAIVVEHV